MLTFEVSIRIRKRRSSMAALTTWTLKNSRNGEWSIEIFSNIIGLLGLLQSISAHDLKLKDSIPILRAANDKNPNDY